MANTTWQRWTHWWQRGNRGSQKNFASEQQRSSLEQSKSQRRFIKPDAFNPDKDFVPTPGLYQRIREYTKAGRCRTALEELLQILQRKPGDQEALFLAAIVLPMTRTQKLTTSEPLGEQYTYDPLLDPIWVVCCECESNWVPDMQIGSFEFFTILNPIGAQCQSCGYTLCDNCLKKTKGTAVYEHLCPHCKTEKLTAPVRPTGRSSAQLPKSSAPITTVIFFREGPVPPDPEYMQAFFETCSPDVLKYRSRIYRVALGAWPESIVARTMAYMLQLSVMGEIEEQAIETAVAGTVVDEHGARVHLVKLYETCPIAQNEESSE